MAQPGRHSDRAGSTSSSEPVSAYRRSAATLASLSARLARHSRTPASHARVAAPGCASACPSCLSSRESTSSSSCACWLNVERVIVLKGALGRAGRAGEQRCALWGCPAAWAALQGVEAWPEPSEKPRESMGRCRLRSEAPLNTSCGAALVSIAGSTSSTITLTSRASCASYSACRAARALLPLPPLSSSPAACRAAAALASAASACGRRRQRSASHSKARSGISRSEESSGRSAVKLLTICATRASERSSAATSWPHCACAACRASPPAPASAAMERSRKRSATPCVTRTHFGVGAATAAPPAAAAASSAGAPVGAPSAAPSAAAAGAAGGGGGGGGGGSPTTLSYRAPAPMPSKHGSAAPMPSRKKTARNSTHGVSLGGHGRRHAAGCAAGI